ncbi:hypothetical protein AUJ67_05965 [Candidatus Desantisbacteria bacterium CG1_02_49_89]|nr:MAG: hypothetical protein AUJ67_05965 [Candidatus Desantisbacteria bacterium CG1_02_49_89]
MIFVTGANGMVGSYVSKFFKEKELIATDIDTLDIKDPAGVMKAVKKAKPDFVIHLAAKTDVDRCQIEPDDAFLSNTIGTQNVALACQETGAVMVYVSTSGVFDGKKEGPYTEFDGPSPANTYGRTKLEGEKAVQGLLKKYYIVRAGWMIGGGQEKDKKFVGKIVRQFREIEIPEQVRAPRDPEQVRAPRDPEQVRAPRDARQAGTPGPEILAVNDKHGTLTYAPQLVEGIRDLMKTGYYGLYHMANTGVCSRYDVAVEIGRILGKNIPVRPVDSSRFPSPAPRARSEALESYKLKLLGMAKMGTWQDALKDYLSTWKL